MAKLEVRHNFKHIFFLIFETNVDMASTLLRFQEFYESPKFHKKIFTVREYKEWYRKEFGRFTYNTDWSGFNFPSKVFKPFYDGRFNPLTIKELRILNIFRNIPRPFYVIAAARDSDPQEFIETRRHEMAHGLFYTDRIYRRKVTDILSLFSTENIAEEIRKKGGYASHVINDEIQAHIIDNPASLKSKVPKELQKLLNKTYNIHKDRNSLMI